MEEERKKMRRKRKQIWKRTSLKGQEMEERKVEHKGEGKEEEREDSVT